MIRASGQSLRQEAGGFLMTEALATFTISALILLGLASVSSVMVRAVDHSIAQAQDVDDLGRTVDAIARDISTLKRARWNGIEPQAFVFRGGPNSIFFASQRRSVGGSSESVVVALREIIDTTGTHLMRSDARLSARATGFEALQYAPARELGLRSARLRFFYVLTVPGNERPLRLDSWPVGQTLPTTIVIEAVDRDTRRLIISMPVPIRRNADIGCLEQNDDRQADVAPAAAVAANASQSASGAEQPLLSEHSPGDAPTPAPVVASIDPGGFCGRRDTRPSPSAKQNESASSSTPAGSTP